MRRGLRKTTTDLLHNHGVWMMPNIYAGIAAREAQLPLVFAPRGMFSEWAMASSWGRKSIAWWCLGQRRAVAAATCFHATSESEAQDIRRLGLTQPIAVVPNGIDIPEIEDDERAKDSDGRLRLLFLSRIHPKKGLFTLLRAWQQLEHRYPEWDLILAGPDDGGHLKEVQAMVKELALRRVAFPGPVYGNAKQTLYRNANLFILPTHSENFGVAVAEALSYSLPVITTTGAPWGELEDRQCGWWIKLSEANLASVLQDAMALPENNRRGMGRRGRLWMQEKFCWPQIAKSMKGLYEWILGGGSPPAFVSTK
jgi:glycosyltransferase involved in cell wall biosynthesis